MPSVFYFIAKKIIVSSSLDKKSQQNFATSFSIFRSKFKELFHTIFH